MGTSVEKWDRRFLQMAKLVGSWSKDPSSQVGAVITDTNNRIISLGYNGLPRGVGDRKEFLEDRDTKYQVVIHAEDNALLFAGGNISQGGVIYTWPFQPCSRCASKIIQAGIKRVVSVECDRKDWQDNFLLTAKLFKEAGVDLTLYSKFNATVCGL